MSALLLVARAEARRRRAGLLGLALIVALVGTAVLGSVAGARRSASALDRLQDATDARDGRAFAYVLGDDVVDDLVAEVAALDGVEQVGGSVIYGTDASFDIDTSILAPTDDVQYQSIDRPLLLDGRFPDPAAADEVVISELVVENLGLHTGDRLQAHTFSTEDCEVLAANGFQGFNGPALDLAVVGEVRVPEELQGSEVDAGPVAIATPAFYAEHGDDACAVGVFASARYAAGGGPSDSEMTAAARRAAPETGELGAGSIETEFLDAVRSAVDVAVTALLLFALVTAAAGLLALTQAVIRQVASADRVDETLGAVGFTRGQRSVAVALPLVMASAVGAVLAGLGAVALSPVFPLGVAREAEPDPGLHSDGWVLAIGAVLLVVVVAFTAVLAARRAARRAEAPDRAPTVAGAVTRSGAPPSVVVGLGLVGDRSRGRSAVRTAMVGAAVALAGVCAVAVLSSSLADVLDEPDRYGWPWTAKPDLDSDDPEATIARIAEEEPDVAAIGVVQSASLDVDDQALEGFALEVIEGSITFPTVEGRAPAASTEVALGAGALPERAVGDTITLSTPDDPTVELQVVGRVVLPHTDSVGGNSALVVPELMPDLGVETERSLVLTYAEGADVDALEARLEDEHGLFFPAYARPNPPGRLVNLDEIGSLLTALAAFFTLLGIAGLVHALTTSSRRHRGLFATLRSLGFVRRQVVRSVVISAVAIVGVSALVGIPVGVVVGRQAWLRAVEDLGILNTPTVPTTTIAAVVAAALTVAVIVAALPAWRASRRHPAEMLRVE